MGMKGPEVTLRYNLPGTNLVSTLMPPSKHVKVVLPNDRNVILGLKS